MKFMQNYFDRVLTKYNLYNFILILINEVFFILLKFLLIELNTIFWKKLIKLISAVLIKF